MKHPFEHFDEIPASWLINDNVQRVLTRERQGNYLIRTSLTRKTDAKGSNLQVALQTSGTNDRSKSFTAASTTYFRLTSSTGQDSAYTSRRPAGTSLSRPAFPIPMPSPATSASS